jgi:poly(hydroxyalkanoate) granule-associated protein
MVKKIQKTGSDSKASASASNSPLSGAIKDSAQQIWLAGLGAFSKAQEEGGKAFESLVKEGLSIQRKTQAVAEERISEATNRVSSMATDISSKAAGQWDKLENIFEERVAKALNKLVQRLGGKAPAKTAARKAAPAKKAAPARKAARKTTRATKAA